MSRRKIDVSQPGAEVHSRVPGCEEERVLRGDKITPEVITALAENLAAMQDPAAKRFGRLVMEIMLSRAAVAEVVDGGEA